MDKKILEIFIDYKNKRDKFNKTDLSNRLVEIKDKAINNHDELYKKAKKEFVAQGFNVYELRDKSELPSLLDKLIIDDAKIVKSKSNVFKELEISKYFKKRNIECLETDLGDFLNEFTESPDIHPVLPALELKKDFIVKQIFEKYNEKIEATAEDIAAFAKKIIAKRIDNADIGISGANAFTSNGEVVILENEGNISKLTRIPKHHIIFLGIEKLLENIEDAMHVVKCSAVWGTGQSWPAYVNIIAGPSKTADIENELIIGAQGASKVSLVLVDNGRKNMLEKYKDLWRCINCGSCLNFCPVYYQDLNNFGYKYLGAKGILWTAFNENLNKAKEAGIYKCSTCEACFEHCPAQINLPEYIRELRYDLIKEGVETSANQEMMQHIRETGNPFGKMEDGEIPKKLYCC